MTLTPATSAATTAPAPGPARDRRGSPIPTWAMVTTRFMELRKRRGLMITLSLVTIGIPTVFLAIRLVLHAVAPQTYGPAGGYNTYTGLSSGVLYTFGFIVAATLGCSAGSVDLSDGMFRHLVITGRSRLALYLARIPAGLAIIAPLVAFGFSIVCAVCVLAAPTTLSYDGLRIPAGMSRTALETWAADNASKVVCYLPYDGPIEIPADCGGGPGPGGPGATVIQKGGPVSTPAPADPAQLKAVAIRIADQNYADYARQFLYPPVSLMVKTGLWIELETAIAFVVGLGLGSLLGQRTVSVVMMIVLELVLTPIVLRAQIPHMINVQRGVVGVATARLEPGQLPLAFGGGGHDFRVTESATTAVLVILGWLIVWTGLGAWRMSTRDA